MLDAEADRLVNAERYAHDEERQGYRSGHYDRNFTTTSGDVNLRVPKLKGLTFETAIDKDSQQYWMEQASTCYDDIYCDGIFKGSQFGRCGGMDTSCQVLSVVLLQGKF